MVDLHIHILPGIDDGSKSFEMSLEMAKMAYNDGVTDMIVTPHCNIPELFNNYESDALIQYFNDFKHYIHQNGVPLNLYRGMEIFATEDIFDFYQTGRVITLNDSRYLLVEFDFKENPNFVMYCLENLIDLGVTPIVAHPERYFFVYDFPNIAYQWTEMGCLSQINKDSLLGNFGKTPQNFAVNMIENGLAHFVASDSHSHKSRTPELSGAYEFITEKWSQSKAYTLLCENPTHVIHDEAIEIAEPKPLV